MQRDWTDESILAGIKKRTLSGLPMNSQSVSQSDYILWYRAGRVFGNWTNALKAAGLTAKTCNAIKEDYTPDQIIARIRALAACGIPIYLKYVSKHYRRLYLKARAAFGQWDDVLLAAGFDPDSIRRNVKPWRDETVLSEIRRRYRNGEPLHAGAVRPVSLYQYGVRRYGSWPSALKAAGIDPKRVLIFQGWSRERVIKEIRDRVSRSEPINFASVPAVLSTRATEYFGSWDAAVKAAGFDPKSVRQYRRKWTPITIIEQILLLNANGSELNRSAIQPLSLVEAGCHHFGSWDGALEAAGLDAAQFRKVRRPWSRAEVISAIKERRDACLPLNYCTTIGPNMYPVIRRHFGSWLAALKAAGIRPKTVCSVSKPVKTRAR